MLYVESKGQGPALLLVHGFPLDGSMWSGQADGLADLREVLVPDLLGHGRSPRGDAPDLSMERQADELALLLDARGVDRVDLVGFSMGGYVALAFAERHPARLTSLGLVDTRAEADSPEGRRARDEAAALVRREGAAALAETLVPKLVAPGADDAVRERVRAMITSNEPESIAMALEGMRDRQDRTRLLPRIDVPTLVLVGEQDALTPPEVAYSMVHALPNARGKIVLGAGHMAPVEAPGAVLEHLRAFYSE